MYRTIGDLICLGVRPLVWDLIQRTISDVISLGVRLQYVTSQRTINDVISQCDTLSAGPLTEDHW